MLVLFLAGGVVPTEDKTTRIQTVRDADVRTFRFFGTQC
jgi:hypothetical protein